MSKVFTITEGLDNLGAFRTGGQGSVYKGRRIGEIITAVKLLPTPIFNEDLNNKSYVDFQNEVAKLTRVNENPSPHVVKILSSGLTDSGSFPFIEMEYIEGPDLEDLLKAPHDPIFRIKDVIQVAEHISNALAHCHAVDIKHGDMKSNNIKYNVRSGNYVLLDFGMAIMSDEQRRTSLRQAGAIEFMAPEQYEGQILFQSDIYSFGVVMYELLAGQVPFPLHENGETARNNVRLSHIEAAVPDLLELRRSNMPAVWTAEQREIEMNVPKWLINLVAKCLEKEPGRRFTDGIALKEYIYHNSIYPGPGSRHSQEPGHSIEYYQAELKKTRAEVNRLTEENLKHQRRSGVYVPMPLLVGLLAIFLSVAIYAGVSAFRKTLNLDTRSNPELITDVRDQRKAAPTTSLYPALKNRGMDDVAINLDSIKKAEMRVAAEKERRAEQTRKAAAIEKAPKERKGLFDFLFKKKKKKKK